MEQLTITYVEQLAAADVEQLVIPDVEHLVGADVEQMVAGDVEQMVGADPDVCNCPPPAGLRTLGTVGPSIQALRVSAESANRCRVRNSEG